MLTNIHFNILKQKQRLRCGAQALFWWLYVQILG